MVGPPRNRGLRSSGKKNVLREDSDNEDDEEEYRGKEEESSQQTPASLSSEPENRDLVIENDFTADMVEVHVGSAIDDSGVVKATAVFHVHKSILVKASPWFATALIAPSGQSETNKLTLENETPAIFAMLAKSMYLGYLNLLEFPKTGGIRKDDKIGNWPFYAYLGISIEKYQLKQFENGLKEWWNKWEPEAFTTDLSGSLMWYVYDETKPGSALRSFLLSILVQLVLKDPANIDEFEDCATEFPKIGIALSRALAERAKPPSKKQRVR